MRVFLVVMISLLSLDLAVLGQAKRSVVIGALTERPNAVLILNPENADQGFLAPQLTTSQRLQLTPSSPEEDGLLVFDTTEQSFYFWTKGTWTEINARRKKQEGFRAIDPVQFHSLRHDNVTHDNLVVFETDNTFVTALRGDSDEQMIAPVDVPHGAAITDITVYFMDDDDQNISVKLMRKDFVGNNEELLGWQSSGKEPVIRTGNLQGVSKLDMIDLQKYTYRLLVSFDLKSEEKIDRPSDAKQRIYGVRIKYLQ